MSTPLRILASITRPGAGSFRLERAGLLTPYDIETITEDALGAGRGARLEVTLPAHAGNGDLGSVERRFAWLRARGLDVCVRRTRHSEARDDAA